MKLVQIWNHCAPSLGIQTEQGIVDVLAEAARRGTHLPFENMMDAIRMGQQGLELLSKLSEGAQCFTQAPLAPVVTGTDRIFCIGLNYRQHAKECNLPLPAYPVLFTKFGNALSAHGDCIRLMPDYKEYDYEAELVVVMGKPARNVSEADALSYVYGYTCGNDLSTRDLQFARGGQWVLSKALDGFAPVGPCLVPAGELDPNNLDIASVVNGELRQNSNTSDMIFSVQQVIADLSRHLTLLPGDLIFTGTPQGVMHGYPADKKNWLKPGDQVDIIIQNIGTLSNTFC
ncbi:MAG: fumarylacetoacetate hydrolase family protein [Lawsonibacter sp.]|nr:fumarylacetoacetate hydrolase family protein [Lawsonibacter sp.]